MDNKKKTILGSFIISVLVLTTSWIVWGNVTVKTTAYNIYDAELPAGFDGFKIAQISDLHNATFGRNNSVLIGILRDAEPDVIVITGDMVDSDRTDLAVAVAFAEQAVGIAPCCYVTGNHEAWLKEFAVLEEELVGCGVSVLRNRAVEIERGGDSIQIIGIDDPDFAVQRSMFDISPRVIASEIENSGTPEGYRVLLSHRAEAIDIYAAQEINLVFAGHAHGGQFRIPFIGGVFAPGQGFFPRYDSGVYREGSTIMVVSRGIGNSIIPVRLNNRPEIVIATLHNIN